MAAGFTTTDKAMKKIDVNGRPTRGNAKAKVVAVNYDDFECPFCKQFHGTMRQVMDEYGAQAFTLFRVLH